MTGLDVSWSGNANLHNKYYRVFIEALLRGGHAAPPELSADIQAEVRIDSDKVLNILFQIDSREDLCFRYVIASNSHVTHSGEAVTSFEFISMDLNGRCMETDSKVRNAYLTLIKKTKNIIVAVVINCSLII